jgi:murein DD-endopeptidase MepM/ murein hydrolase activator NlpD
MQIGMESQGAALGRKDPRRQFSLLLVRGDGARVLRVNFPRPVVTGTLAALAICVAVLGGLVGDWVQLRALTREARTFSRQIADQRATIDSFNRRVAELRKEMGGWRELHARIWEPFGPELTPGRRDRGIGGGSREADRSPASLDQKLDQKEEIERLAESVVEQGDNLRALDRLMTRAGKALAALPSRWPVRGAVNSEFGNRLSPWSQVGEFHGGLDIKASHGTPVRAPAAGTVTFAGAQPEYGILVILEHDNDVKSMYGHLSKTSVKQGDWVQRGGVIGFSGNTGRSSGPHLHYEVLVKGQPVNPRAYLWD